ncbi:hypothetical protein ACH4NS_28785 [Streptomyces mutabilis]|uniref:hypothetical protein n=1 Tax=Streptomyces TaxID=1883 RepID=UPI0037A639B3
MIFTQAEPRRRAGGGGGEGLLLRAASDVHPGAFSGRSEDEQNKEPRLLLWAIPQTVVEVCGGSDVGDGNNQVVGVLVEGSQFGLAVGAVT